MSSVEYNLFLYDQGQRWFRCIADVNDTTIFYMPLRRELILAYHLCPARALVLRNEAQFDDRAAAWLLYCPDWIRKEGPYGRTAPSVEGDGL